MALFFVWNIAAALAPNVEALMAFRFLAGFGASASLSVGGGVIADLFDEEHRGGATAIFALGPVLGPVLGPIAGGYLAEGAGWRWARMHLIDTWNLADATEDFLVPQYCQRLDFNRAGSCEPRKQSGSPR